MIRVELLGRKRGWPPWSKALLAALVVCGGLYGVHHFFPGLARSLDSVRSPVSQQESTTESEPSAVVQQDAGSQQDADKPKETSQQAVVQQESTPEPEPNADVQQDDKPEEVSQQAVVQQESTPEPAPSPIAQQDVDKPEKASQEAVVQQETTPSPVAQQDDKPEQSSPSPTPSPVRDSDQDHIERAATSTPSRPIAATPQPTTQRNAACHQVMRIDEQVPAGIVVASLNCNSTGEYWLEGTTPSYKVLRQFRLLLQALPSQLSFSTWYEKRTLRFTFQGRFSAPATPPPAALSPGQAKQFFSKIAHWAKASGLDSLSINEPIHLARTHQRQKLRGIGSPQQIGAFLRQFQQAESSATLGEVLLMPVSSDESGWVKARLYAAVDIIVQGGP